MAGMTTRRQMVARALVVLPPDFWVAGGGYRLAGPVLRPTGH